MRSRFWLAVLSLGAVLWAGLAVAPLMGDTRFSKPGGRKAVYSQFIATQTAGILDQLQTDGRYPAALVSLQALFDQAVLYTPADAVDPIREADFALRLVSQLSRVPKTRRDELLTYLRKHDNLARTLVFLIRPDQRQPARVYEVLDQLRKTRGEQIDEFVALAAAISVVQEVPMTEELNENSVTSPGPVDLFDYYTQNQNRMYFGIKNVPAELLVYVVDTTASIDEMQWALNRYGGNSNVGSLFFTIPYDYDYLKRGTDKTVTVKGYNLPNILKFGGVCIDQAYFATTVGKAIGVPTALDTGESAEAAHAWAGFLQFNGRSAGWNFDSGRYEEFQGVRGDVRDPQSRNNIPDSYVSLLGEMIGTSARDRENAVALTDAANRMSDISQAAAVVVLPVDAVMSDSVLAKPRRTDVPAQLDLLEQALKQSVAYAPAWFAVRDLALAKKLDGGQKREWSDVLLRLGARKYPDFTLECLMPMVQSIDDPQEQDSLLNRMLPLFASRLDLSANILMAQAKLWENHGQPDRAGEYYLQVIQRYTNAGPFVMDALKGAEKLLRSQGHTDRVVLLYAQAWKLTAKPDAVATQFLEESNWYQIGKAYADQLNQAGDTTAAAVVELKLAS